MVVVEVQNCSNFINWDLIMVLQPHDVVAIVDIKFGTLSGCKIALLNINI